MAKIIDPWDHHDWSSRKYVSQWARRQDEREGGRREIFTRIARTLSMKRETAVRILDLGAGYGALAQFLLEYFPNAEAVCQDGSAEMARLGRRRMATLKGRFRYILCDFSEPGWSRKIGGPFDAAVSSIAIHNVRSPDIIRAIYAEIFSLVKPGGCFLNFDRMHPSRRAQLAWLREAGFARVKCLWNDGRRALIGGYRQRGRARREASG